MGTADDLPAKETWRFWDNSMTIDTLSDACEVVLREQGEPQSSYWLATQVMEMKLWRASEADVRDALNKDIAKLSASSRFVKLADDEFALRSWPTA
jgi:DNA-directed RNA polymerase delta subunit